MEVKFILIRHGESLGNAQKLYLGHTDLDLSEKGREQARAAAEYFKNEDICAIYSSDLKRAYNTGLAHAKLRGMSVIPSTELREVHVGLWEGKHIEYIREKWAYEFDVAWKERFGDMAPPEGESVYSAAKRMYDKLISIAKETNGKVIVTAHAAVIRALWCYINGAEPSQWASFAPFPTNASATFVGYDGEKLIPIRYSFDEYLNVQNPAVTEA